MEKDLKSWNLPAPKFGWRKMYVLEVGQSAAAEKGKRGMNFVQTFLTASVIETGEDQAKLSPVGND
jgi:hypothetical protein